MMGKESKQNIQSCCLLLFIFLSFFLIEEQASTMHDLCHSSSKQEENQTEELPSNKKLKQASKHNERIGRQAASQENTRGSLPLLVWLLLQPPVLGSQIISCLLLLARVLTAG